MNILEIAPRFRPETRRVWIAFEGPGPRTAAAMRVLRETQVAVDLEGDTVLYVDTVRTNAAHMQGLLERATGRPAINDWNHLPNRKENA